MTKKKEKMTVEERQTKLEEEILEISNLVSQMILRLKRESRDRCPPFVSKGGAYYARVANQIRAFFSDTGFKKAVIGLSGGIDSAVVAVLLCKALGRENVIAYYLPTKYSAEASHTYASALADNLGIYLHFIDIESTCVHIRDRLAFGGECCLEGIADENLQSRIRMVYLMAVANQKNALLIDTSNRTEIILGYYTLYGDGAGSLAPIGDLNKLQVYELAEFINARDEIIPRGIITRVPTAELSNGQVDPFDYKVVSELADLLDAQIRDCVLMDPKFILKYPRKLVDDLSKRIEANLWKRELLHIPTISMDGFNDDIDLHSERRED